MKKKKPFFSKKRFDAIFSNLLVVVLVLIWLIPVIWIIASSFSTQKYFNSPTFFPTEYTFDNYIRLFKETLFAKWLLNTFIIALINCFATTFFTILTSYVLSRFRFKMRKVYMNISLVLGMFPGFMSMVAVYFILSQLNLINSIWSLLVYYVCGAGLGFFISKGYFDTISYEIDEAAFLEGANHIQIFFKIFLPLAKPIIIYTALLAFMAPWADYILAGLILTKDDTKTVAVGLYEWMDSAKINTYFTLFAAGSVIVAVPIVTLYLSLQKFFIHGISSGAVKG